MLLMGGIFSPIHSSIEANANNQTSITIDSSSPEHTEPSPSATYTTSTQLTDPNLNSKNSATTFVTIPDKLLRETILASLNKPATSDLTIEDMEKVTTIVIPNNISLQVSSLSGLEYATNLSQIYLVQSNVVDFSPLEALSSLVYVDLGGATLNSSNFPDLSRSTGIKRITASSARLDDSILPELAQFESLERIYLDSNINITTLEPLKDLPNLRSISVQFCGIKDFTVINEFPELRDLSAFGQYIKPASTSTVTRADLSYDAATQSVFIPFSLMPDRLTNFDGYLPQFTTSISVNDTRLKFNGTLLSEDQLAITDQGITVSNITESTFGGLTSLEYDTRFDNPAGSYSKPSNYSFYSISSGTYHTQLTVIDAPKDGAPVIVHYHDESGQPIEASTILSGKVGDSFSLTAKVIPNWNLKSAPATTNGMFTETKQELTFIYEKASAAPVTVHYVDEANNQVAEPNVLNGRMGEPYKISSKELSGWELKDTQGSSSGFFSGQPQSIIYIYTKTEEPVLPPIEHPDQPVFPKQPTETLQHELVRMLPSRLLRSEKEDTQEKEKQSPLLNVSLPNTLTTSNKTEPISSPAKTNAKNKQDKGENKGVVVIKFVDENGNEIKSSRTLTGKVGETYSVSAKELN